MSESRNHQLSLRAYITGFGLSVYLTLVAYFVVTRDLLQGNFLVGGILSLAVIQFVVQVIYFLHLGQEKRPRWKLVMFAFMLQTVFIVVFGTLWIMSNLEYHHGATPQQLDQSIIKDEGLQPRP